MNLFFLSQRNLLRQRRRYIFLASAIAFGFAVLASLSLIVTGMLKNLEAKASVYYGGNATVLGYANRDNARIDMNTDFAALKQAILENSGTDATVSLRYVNRATSTVLFFAGNSVRQRIVVGLDWGAEAPRFKQLTQFQNDISDLDHADTIVISEPAAKELGVKIGDDVLIALDTTSGERNTGTLVIRGIVKDSSFLGYYTSYVDRRTLNNLVRNVEDWADEVSIFVDKRMKESDYDSLQTALEKSVRMFPRITEKQENLFNQLNESAPDWDGRTYALVSLPAHLAQIRELVGAVEAVIGLLQTILLLILTIGVANTYRVIVNERRKEIGTMRAIGLTKSRVLALFCLESVWLALSGLVAGVALSALFVTILSFFQFSWITGLDIFLLNGHFSASVDTSLLIRNTVFLFAACMVGALFPARRAVKMRPVDALRSQ